MTNCHPQTTMINEFNVRGMNALRTKIEKEYFKPLHQAIADHLSSRSLIEKILINFTVQRIHFAFVSHGRCHRMRKKILSVAVTHPIDSFFCCHPISLRFLCIFILLHSFPFVLVMHILISFYQIK